MNREPHSDALRLDTSSRAAPVPERSPMSPAISLLSMPPVSPDPAYIAAAAAANVVTSEIINEYHISFPQDQEHEGASVTPASLSLINAFLDRLLFNFLSCAHSTSLASLRPAVTEVLRPRLAKEAIGGADEELQEYLGGDMEELNTFHGGEEPSGDWDLDLVWKRTRLRCMLYTRLGDMEEEDEEMYLEQEHLNAGDRSSQREGGMVSPAVAIFLTSVLEFVGEHALMVAAQAAYKRHQTRARIEESGLQKVTVEEVDMEKVALNSTLGRLWRSWRASIRSPRGSLSRISGVGSRGARGFSIGSRSSIGTSERDHLEEPDRVPSVAEVLGNPDPSTIPLPSTDHDVAEIEVPGYTANLAQRQRKTADERERPLTMFVRTDVGRSGKESNQLETVVSDEESTPRQEHAEQKGMRPRAHSLPTPDTPFFVPDDSPDSEAPYLTPDEEAMPAQDLKDHDRSIIDMSGNSVREIIDYAIPKSSSAPTSPFHGSDFNATSHIAHEYELHGRGSYIDYQSENDPADGALPFSRNDYKVDDSERAALKEHVASQHIEALQPPYENKDFTQQAVSPVVEGAPGSGRVSPVGQASIPSGEVSPIEPSDDEEELYIESTQSEPVSHEAVEEEPLAQETVPEEPPEAPPKSEISRGPIVAKAETQKSYPAESATQEIQEATTLDHNSRPAQGRHRAKAGPAEDDYQKEERREAFVLPPEDFNANNQLPDGSSLSRRPLPPDVDPNRKYRSAGAESPSAGGLLPVDERREHATESQEKPALQPASQAQFARKAVPPSPSSPLVRPPASNQGTEPRRQLSGASAGHEIAPVQRAAAAAAATRDAGLSPSRSSDVGNHDVRTERPPAAPKNRSRVGSAPTERLREATPSRTSSDLNKTIIDEKQSRSSTASNADTQKNFEQLINSGETLQYTLTPQNMREIEERGSPSQQNPSTPVPTQVRSRGPSLVDRPSPKQSRSSGGPSPAAVNGLKSHPVANTMSEETPNFVIHSGPTVKRGPQLVAKDARMERTNTSDLKDFFRSTGPDGVDARGTTTTTQSAQPGSKAMRKSPPALPIPVAASRSFSSSTTSSKPKLKFEPREPTRQGNETSQLAEFFRSGPPGAHRVPDADDATVRPRDTQSIASTQDSFIARSVQSSTNSRTGLLDSSRNVGKASAWEKRPTPFPDEPIAPVRKQRRVKDPYAIDSDDEDEDEMAQTPRGGRNQDNEESLLDFLRSEPPPGANVTPPPLDVGNTPSRPLQRKPSGSGMRSRFALSGSKNASTKSSSNHKPLASPNDPRFRSGASDSGYEPPKPSANDPHLYAKSGNGQASAYGGSAPPRSRNTGLGASGAGTGRVNNVRAARKQARDSRDNTNSVRELAEFLRNTAPPTQQPLPPTPVKEESGFSRMFSRRKKSTAAS